MLGQGWSPAESCVVVIVTALRTPGCDKTCPDGLLPVSC